MTYERGKPNDGPLAVSPRSTKLLRTRLSHVPQHRAKIYLRRHLLLGRLDPVGRVKRCPEWKNAALYTPDTPGTVHRHLLGIDTDNNRPSSPYRYPNLQVYLGKLLDY